jgi:hypothetical protein
MSNMMELSQKKKTYIKDQAQRIEDVIVFATKLMIGVCGMKECHQR